MITSKLVETFKEQASLAQSQNLNLMLIRYLDLHPTAAEFSILSKGLNYSYSSHAETTGTNIRNRNTFLFVNNTPS
jgi:hypothetical protein